MNDTEIKEKIKSVLTDIREKGFSTQQPFEIGAVEQRMIDFAEANGITLGSESLYMSAKQLQHSIRKSKREKALVVDDEELIAFPQQRFSMKLYYDGECFIYASVTAKFIIHPNYEVKIRRDFYRVVNYITATKRKDIKEFNGQRYVEIKTDRNTKK